MAIQTKPAGIETRPVQVTILTAEWEIEGTLNVKHGGYRNRPSDMLNDPALRFVPLTDVVVHSRTSDAPARSRPFVLVNVGDITCLEERAE